MSVENRAREASRVDIHGAFVRRTDLSGASLVGANLSRADARGAIFRGTDFQDANLDGTVLIGADLSSARNLDIVQLMKAIFDETTVLPEYIDRHALFEARAAADKKDSLNRGEPESANRQ
jgi:uncharacterized protein YjbI with pentapeptide repeats